MGGSHTINSKNIGIIGASGNPVEVDSEGQLHIVAEGKIDDGNSSIVPLDAGEVFTGVSIETLSYAVINVSVYSDKGSAMDGLCVEFSTDDVNWDHSDYYTVPAATGKTFSFQPVARYMRVIYTNGAEDQTVFRLQVQLKKTYIKPSSHRIQDMIIGDDDAELIKAVITGKNPSGDYINFTATTSGNSKVSIEEFESDVSINSNKQLKVSLLDVTGRELVFDPKIKSIVVQGIEHNMIHRGQHYIVEDFITLGNDAILNFCIITPDTAKLTHIVWGFGATAQMEFEIYKKASFASDGDLVTPKNSNSDDSWAGTHTPVGSSATILTDGTQAWTTDELIGLKIYNITDESYGIILSNTTTTVTVTALIGGTDNDFDQNDQYVINNSSLIIESGCTISDVGIKVSGVSSGSSTNPTRGISGGSDRTDEIILGRNEKWVFRFTSRLASNILSYKAKWYEHIPA